MGLLLLVGDVLYRRFHHPDGSTDYLQIILPAKLRRPYLEKLHADFGHFGQTKTSMVASRLIYFPGWRRYTKLIVRNCTTCNLHQRGCQAPRQAALRPMVEFRPMAVLHADLVGKLPEGKNSKNQRGFHYILSVVDAATRYLWLLPLRRKTADEVATVLYDDVNSRVSVPSAIVSDLGRELTGEVMERLCDRLGVTHLRTTAYHPQTDAKCESVHFSVHNMITKLVDEQHEKWPDLLGTVSLAYNCTIHTATGYNPHELFYSFSPSCPLDAQVDAPSENPVNNADAYALQAEDRLRDAFTYMRKVTGRQMERMKRYYDASVKPARFDEGNFHVIVLSEEEAGIILKMASDVDWAVSSDAEVK